ncbi:hypothetical protein JCM10207_000712 [Rhodosporidiobolus poonsookiae]
MAATQETGNGMLADVVSSVFTPGTNPGLVRAMNYSFYALFVTLAGMLALTGGSVHVLALLVLSVALFASIRWFLVQIAEEEERQRQERLAKDKREGKDTSAAEPSKGKTE